MQSSTSITLQEHAAIASVHAGLIPIIKLATKTSPISLAIILTLLLVSKNEGRTVRELAKVADVSPSAMSRILADLSSENKWGGQGLGLIEQRVDEKDSRFMRSYLSVQGRALIRTIAAAVDRSGGLKAAA